MLNYILILTLTTFIAPAFAKKKISNVDREPSASAITDAKVACPSFIMATTNETIRGVNGKQGLENWQTEPAPDRRDFIHASLYDGPPSELANLIPDPGMHNGNKVTIWNLNTPAVSGKGYWLQCSYKDTSSTLVMQLPSDVKSCIYQTGKNRRGAPKPLAVFCL